MDYTPNAPQMNQTPEHSGSGGVGTAIAIILILAVLALGAFYFWGQQLAETPQDGSDQVVTELEDSSSSDDLSSIEADLDATDLESLDEGLFVDEGAQVQ